MDLLRLLVVDDDEVDRLAVKRALDQAGVRARVVEAATATEALAAARAGVDCVLLDYQLPGTDGLDVLARLRALDAELPVIALTGHGDQEVAVALMKAGAADYLSKQSLTPDRLDRSIRHALRIAAAERERRALLLREQRAREEAQAANRAKDEFLATLSHELRTPLNTILGWARLLASNSLDQATLARGLKTIERNTVMQAKLIDDLLDISRVITGKLTIERQPLQLSGVVRTVVESLHPTAATQGVTLNLTVAGAEAVVVGDASRLQQVVTNLVSNAIKFTPSGGNVEVAMRFSGDSVDLIVSDTGQGIDPALLPTIFERFRQGDASSTRRHGGLGLGLSIVRHLVDLHGGGVTAHSAGAGCGATFTVTLPTAAGAAAAAVVEIAHDPTALQDLYVLLVDDDADNRELQATVLRHHGAAVVTAGSAREALAALAMQRPHILVSDIAMPEQDGYTFVRQFRAALGTEACPAIAITAFASAEDRTRALAAGFQMHLAKPVEPEMLVASVAALAGRTRPAPPAPQLPA